jgi:AraC-like DNA-binding protein
MGYRGKLHERDHARRLRAKGWTMPDIAAELGVSRGSVSLWTRDMAFQPRLWKRPPGRRGPNALQRRKAEEIERLLAEGRQRIGNLTEKEFLVAGAALYAGEGAKTGSSVIFANTDGRMMRLFCAWLRRFFPVDESRLRVRIYLHQGLDLDAATAYWSGVTGIPVEQFRSPYRAVPDPTIRHAKHEHGCAYVRYSCSRTLRAVLGLVAGLLTCDAIPG